MIYTPHFEQADRPVCYNHGIMLVKPIHGRILAFFPVGGLFRTSWPNTLACGMGTVTPTT